MSSSNVVLVGAGFGGLLLVKELAAKLADTNYNLIVVEPRNFFLHQPSTLRMVVSSQDGYENKSIMNHPSSFSSVSGKVRFVQAKATSIVDSGTDGGRVVLDNGESVDFSVLVLATGSRWSGPIAFGTDRDQIMDTVATWRTKFAEAQDIVLVGGGAIGFGIIFNRFTKCDALTSVPQQNYLGKSKIYGRQASCFDLVLTIFLIYPDQHKRVTIVHAHSLPLNDAYPDRWRKDIGKKSQKRGVQLVMADHVTNIDTQDGRVVTQSGQSIPADLVVRIAISTFVSSS